MMQITIHRGANQIGGCITEIKSEGAKILIDLGSNLPSSVGEEFTKEQIATICDGVGAIFYTHYHGDHVGLMHLVPKHIPQYIGEGAKAVMQCKYNYLDQAETKAAIQQMRTFHAQDVIEIGVNHAIRLTPYFVSHSAFDAYMFKIECEGRVVLHTGDFRRHGYLGKGLFPTLKAFVGRVDVLISEGTMLGRRQERVLTEAQIERNVAQFLRDHKYVFALGSSTDIDRLASFHNACKVTGRTFLVDAYQQDVLDIFKQFASSETSCYRFDKAFRLINYKIQNIQRHLRQTGFLMPIRMSSRTLVEGMMAVYDDAPLWLIYSMWSGYTNLTKPYGMPKVVALCSLFDGRVMDGTKDGFHTSGHADVQTLQEVCSCVRPRIGVIPIHKDAHAHYEDLPETKSLRIFTQGETQVENIKIVIR